MQTYVDTYQHTVQNTQQYQYQTSPVFIGPNQQLNQSNSYTVVQQHLPQSTTPTSINHQVLIPLINQNKPRNQQIVPQQTASQQPYQQASQQPVPVFNPPIRPVNPTAASQQPSSVPPSSFNASVIRCKVCSYLFASQHHLVAHMRKHLGSHEYRCACARQFREMQEYVNHLKKHTAIWWCDLCGHQFPVSDRPQKLAAHLDRHVLAGLSEACDFCPLVFVDMQSRMRHVSDKHEDEVRQVVMLNQSRC